MPIKIYKKVTSGRRQMSISKLDTPFDGPMKRLTKFKKRNVGRSGGKISVRHKGGGHKRKYRLIDFKFEKIGVEAKIERIERDPNRSARIALLKYRDGEWRYSVAVQGVKPGDSIICAEKAQVKPGNRMMIKNIPVGVPISLLELFPGKGAQAARSAGSFATIQALDQQKAQVKMSSGEIRIVNWDCYATIGQVSNAEHNAVSIGKAGRSRWMGIRPSVRGSAMNPVDHPHGGGEGCQPIGLKSPKTPWGKPALGKKTRRKYKYSNKFIVKRRK